MTEISEIEIPRKELMSGLTLSVKIKGMRYMPIRIWIASKLIAMAAGVVGCDFEVDIEGL